MSRFYSLSAVLLSGGLTLLAAGGCSPRETVYATTLENAKFEKKIPAELSLERGLKRMDYVSGKSGQTMIFLLRNKGLRPVKVDEWYMKETENIRLKYAVCEKGGAVKVAEADFKTGWPYPASGKAEKDRGRHMPLQLNPNNAAILEVPLEFLQKFPLKGRPKVSLAVYAELALNTVTAKSPVYEIEVRPIVVEIK